MSKQDKSKPKENSFLLEVKRAEIVAQLKDMGLETDNLDDMELITKLTESLAKANHDLIKREADTFENIINGYASECLITDKKFIEKLYNLNVLPRYLKLFRNEDSELTRAQIWERIRFSSIRAELSDPIDIFRVRAKEPVKKKPIFRRDYE